MLSGSTFGGQEGVAPMGGHHADSATNSASTNP